MVWRRWGSGPSLVLIHGGAGSWMHWIRNIEPLSRAYTVWAPDMPAFGDSDIPPGRLDADTLAPIVSDGMKHVLDEQGFDLVGFSFGGLTSALIAAERPVGLKRLILVSVSALGIVSSAPMFKSMRGIEDPRDRAEVIRVNLNSLMISDPMKIDGLAIAIQQWGTSRERAKNRLLPLTDTLLSLAPQWQCPAYGVWGLNDPIYRDKLEELRGKAALLGLRETLFMKGVGHWLQYEGAQDFNRLLFRLLNDSVAHG
jgi:2-hydroxy-6-oxonona-2,4-dienedioate hydrolase